MKKMILPIFATTLLLIATQLGFTYSSSAPPTEMTNAPGESNCTNCHASALITSGVLWDSITLSSSVPLSSFLPNTTYTLNLRFSDPLRTKYGFELVALPAAANSLSSSIGTMATTNFETELNATLNREYMSHSSTGTSALGGTKTWSFDWTTPPSFSGGVKFYVVINSTNSNGSSSGDMIYAKEFSTTILPVKWSSYSVKTSGNTNNIKWSTASEYNNNYFDIEKSTDAQLWKKIGSIKASKMGNRPNNYSFSDVTNTRAKTYYRIKQVDYNGNFEYSQTLISDETQSPEKVLYNADKGIIQIENISQMASVSLLNLNGNTVAYDANGTELKVASLEKGIYILQLPSGTFQKIYLY